MGSEFAPSDLIEETEFYFGESISPEQISSIHDLCLESTEFDRLEGADILYLVIGNYSEPQKSRVIKVRDELSKPTKHEAFLLEEVDPDIDVWENFYIKFKVFLERCRYVIGVFEDNDGGHELEVSEINLENLYVLKRDYIEASIDNDLEYAKFDAMLGTLFDLLERRDQLSRWETEAQLIAKTHSLAVRLGNQRESN